MNKSILTLLNRDLTFIAYQKQRTGRIGKLKGVLSPSFICTAIYRIGHSLHRVGIPVLPKLFWWLNIILFSSDIDHRAKLYAALYFPHPLAIVIGHQVQIYGSAKIMQGATLGGNLGSTALVEGECISQPKINGNVFIGPNSMVVGPIELTGKLFVGGMVMVSRSINGEGVVGKKALFALENSHRRELGVEQLQSTNEQISVR